MARGRARAIARSDAISAESRAIFDHIAGDDHLVGAAGTSKAVEEV